MRLSAIALCTAAIIISSVAALADETSPTARRLALLQATGQGADAVPVLVKALGDAHPVVQHTAARLLKDQGDAGRTALLDALGHERPVVRRVAVLAAGQLPLEDALPRLRAAISDEHPFVRRTAIDVLLSVRPRTAQVVELLNAARQSSDGATRQAINKALWPFHRDIALIRDRQDWDHDVRIVQTITLPKDGWKFRLDPERSGHLNGWHTADFDDAAWEDIAIEQVWQDAGHDYIGVAWYRRTITLPPKPETLNAIELRCLAVDESAWIWVNGVYVGDHDVGPEGYDREFQVDVTEQLKWGGPNQITIRAMNTVGAGGVYKPVQIEVLE